MMKKFFLILIIAVVCSGVFGEEINWENRTYKKFAGKEYINLVYPSFFGGKTAEKINRNVESRIKKNIDRFEKGTENINHTGMLSLDSDFCIRNIGKIISFEINYYCYYGGENPFVYSDVFNFSAETGRKIGFFDIFDRNTSQLKEKIFALLMKEKEKKGFSDTPLLFFDGALQGFVLEPDGVRWIFQSGEAGDFSQGKWTVFIGYEDLENYFAENNAIKDYVNAPLARVPVKCEFDMSQIHINAECVTDVCEGDRLLKRVISSDGKFLFSFDMSEYKNNELYLKFYVTADGKVFLEKEKEAFDEKGYFGKAENFKRSKNCFSVFDVKIMPDTLLPVSGAYLKFLYKDKDGNILSDYYVNDISYSDFEFCLAFENINKAEDNYLEIKQINDKKVLRISDKIYSENNITVRMNKSEELK